MLGLRRWALLLALALVAAACGDGESGAENGEAVVEEDEAEGLVIDGETIADPELWEAAQEEGGFVFYTALSELREIALLERFEEQVGLDVEIVRLAGGRLFERVQSEHASGLLEADVVRQTDFALAMEHFEAGVFESWCPEHWELVPDDLKDPDCHYYATMQPTYGIAYNTALVEADEAPRSWDDLLDERWHGDIGLPHIGAGGSTWARDMFLRLDKGVEYWEQLASMSPTLTGSAGAVTEELTRGEFAVAMSLPGTVSLAIEEGAPLAIVLPEDGIPAYAQWTGLAAEAANPNAARVFLNWHLSLAGQTAVAERAGDYSIRDDAPGPTLQGIDDVPPAGDADLYYAEAQPEYLENRDAWMAEWFDIFGYTPSDDESG